MTYLPAFLYLTIRIRFRVSLQLGHPHQIPFVGSPLSTLGPSAAAASTSGMTVMGESCSYINIAQMMGCTSANERANGAIE